VAAEHRLRIRDQPQDEVVSAEVWIRQHRLLEDARNERLLEHVDELVDESQLQNLLVDDREHDFQLLVDLPLEKVVVVAELPLRALVVLEEHAPDEDVDQFHVEVGRAQEGFAPQEDPTCRENAHVIKHFISNN